MSTALLPYALRLKLNPTSFEFVADALASAYPTPRLFRGSRARVQLGIFPDDELPDLANLVSLIFQIRPATSPTTAPAASVAPICNRTILAEDVDQSLTAETWAAGTQQHAEVALTAAETNVTPGLYWLYIAAVLSDSADPMTLTSSPLDIIEDGGGDGSEPDLPAGSADFVTALADDDADPVIAFPTAFATAPTRVRASLIAPDNDELQIDAHVHSVTAAGVTLALNAAPGRTGYSVWIVAAP